MGKIGKGEWFLYGLLLSVTVGLIVGGSIWLLPTSEEAATPTRAPHSSEHEEVEYVADAPAISSERSLSDAQESISAAPPPDHDRATHIRPPEPPPRLPDIAMPEPAPKPDPAEAFPEVQLPNQNIPEAESPRIVCPTGNVVLELTRVHLGPYDGFNTRRPVTIEGTLHNDTTAAVSVPLKYLVKVVGIDEAGVVQKTYDPEFLFTPPPGTIRPSEVIVDPGGFLEFFYEADDLAVDWNEIKYWLLNSDRYNYAFQYDDSDVDLTCDWYAEAAIAGSPLPSDP